MDLTPERRAENIRLREAATPGPWLVDPDRKHTVRCTDGAFIGSLLYNVNTDDVFYIVAACNDLPLYESALAESLNLLDRVYQQAGNAAPPNRRHALTSGLRDEIRDHLKAAGYFGGSTP